MLLFILIPVWIGAQELNQNQKAANTIEHFKYTSRGLIPREIHYKATSLNASEIYATIESGFEQKPYLFTDERIKLVKKQPQKSLIIKGLRKYVYCSDKFIGDYCLDAKFEIYVECYDGGYLLKPLRLKRGTNFSNTVWSKIPVEGKANFYKKDGTIKKECSNCVEATEDVLKRIVMLTFAFTRHMKIQTVD